jgi:hypothetical protein
MCQVERDGNARNAVRGKPLFGQPDVRFETNASFIELAVETLDVWLEERTLDLDLKIADPHVEQVLVGELVPGKPVAHATSPLRLRTSEHANAGALGNLAEQE